MASPATAVDQTQFCEICSLSFPSFVAFHNHKVESIRHITCKICSQDFSSQDAAKLHHDQMHAHEQNLDCPGCFKQFSRLGSLIAHIELAQCNAISKRDFDAAVEEKMERDRNSRAARNFQDYSRGASNSSGPNPLAKPTLSSMSARTSHPLQPNGSKPVVFEKDNLISFDESSAILNSGWGAPYTSAAPAFDKNDFPALGSAASSSVKAKHTSRPANQPSPAAPLNLAERVATMTITDSPSDPFDPDTPGFDITTYWISFLGKYKCPYRGCNKSVEKPTAFLQHLKSPAHRSEKLQCNGCLRYFATATALTQHSESQGVRCRIRDSDKYAGVVDVITGGTATTAGRHNDNTVKYALQKGIDPNAGANAIIEANKQQAKDIAQGREDYWKTRTPKW